MRTAARGGSVPITVIVPAVMLVVAGALGGCASDPDLTTATGPSRELAPSQTTPDTVAAPSAPPPCAVDALRFTAASPLVDDGLVVQIENTGAAQCLADLASSPLVDPLMEPDVWLDPGELAEVTVAVDTASCSAPAPVHSLGLVVNGTPLAVEIEPIDACTLTLTALYPAG